MTTGTYGQGAGTLSAAAALVADAQADFDSLSAQLSDQISGAQARWQGQGAQAFFRLHRAWTEKQATIVAALHELEAALTRTEQINVATDDQQSATFTSAASRLG